MRNSTGRGRLTLATLALGSSVLLAAACTDITAPVLPARQSSTTTLGATPTIVVSPTDMKGWTFARAITGQPCDSTACRMVDGPDKPPLGRGSAELDAVNSGATSITLHGFQGTRLDHVSALGYATYRHSADTTDRADVALELTVDFDLSGGGKGDVGEIVFDPPRTTDITPANQWRRLDARAGLWWARHQAPPGASTPLPCVQSRPCTWAELIARYPNIGLHASSGAVTFVGGRSAGFRANVDSLVVGVNGTNTVFDFELVARRNQYVLTSVIDDGAVTGQFPADTLFDEGTAIPYAFTPRPGRNDLLLVLDDTLLVPASGQLVMDGAHRLHVVSDTLYTYETLTPDEKTIADLTKALLASSDRLAALAQLNAFLVDRLNAGVAPEVLARAERIAQFVAIDPVRDAAAMDAVESDLAGVGIHDQRGWDRMYSSVSRLWPKPPASASSLPSGTSGLSPSGSAASASLLPGAAPSMSMGSIPDKNDPHEYTKVLHMNGIFTDRGGAMMATKMIAYALYAKPGFDNYRTQVGLYYNPTWTVQLREFDAAHPCYMRYEHTSTVYSVIRGIVAYAGCQGVSFTKAVTTFDFSESAAAKVQILAGWAPTNDQSVGLAKAVAGYRAQNYHVMLVGHSEGTILEQQAVQWLPAIENHPLEVANRGLTVLALAPAISRSGYALDDYHVMGLLADHDLIKLTVPLGWESVSTPFTDWVGVELLRLAAMGQPAPVIAAYAAMYGYQIHSVTGTYLSGGVMNTVLHHLNEEHEEVVAGTALLEPSGSTVGLGETFTAQLTIWNENGRRLYGRTPNVPDGYAISRLDSLTFRAMVPRDRPWQLAAQIADNWFAQAPITIPVISTPYTFREDDIWQWEVIGASNAVVDGVAVGYDGPGPTEPWDGTTGGCNITRTYYGPAGSYTTYQLFCARVYNPVYVRPDTLPTGRPLSSSLVHWTSTAGVADSALLMNKTPAGFYYYCGGGGTCLSSSYVEHLSPLGVAERSAVVAPTQNIIMHSLVASGGATRSVIAATPATQHIDQRSGWMADGKLVDMHPPATRPGGR